MLTFSVKINGNFIPLPPFPLENKEPRSYKNVNVFSGMCTAANAKLRNLKYTGKGKNLVLRLRKDSMLARVPQALTVSRRCSKSKFPIGIIIRHRSRARSGPILVRVMGHEGQEGEPQLPSCT